MAYYTFLFPFQGASSLSRSNSKKKKEGGKTKSMIVPLPLAIAGGILAGFIAFLWSKRPVYYEVSQGIPVSFIPPVKHVMVLCVRVFILRVGGAQRVYLKFREL
jgi:hypothetical protein